MSFYCGINQIDSIQFNSIQCSTSPMTISSMLIVLPEFSSRQLYRPASSNVVLYIHSSYLPVLGSNNTWYLDSCLQSGIRECSIAAKNTNSHISHYRRKSQMISYVTISYHRMEYNIKNDGCMIMLGPIRWNNEICQTVQDIRAITFRPLLSP